MRPLKGLLALFLFLPLILFAHQRSESYSNWSIEIIENKANIKAAFNVKESVLLKYNLDDLSSLEDYLLKSVSISLCKLDRSETKTSYSKGIYKFSINVDCYFEEGQAVKIDNKAFFDIDSSHSHIARIKVNNKNYPEKIFLKTDQSLEINTKSPEVFEKSSFSSFFSYLGLGLEHISTGFDHLAFLLGLLLINKNLKNIFIAITGFTLGHTLSFCAAVLGVIYPSSGFVEATIGFSIFILGYEYLSRDRDNFLNYLQAMLLFWVFFLISFYYFNGSYLFSGYLGLMIFCLSYLIIVNKSKNLFLSLLITSLFGLVHGFGFGGYLSEVGLPQESIYLALIGFNLGVEIGQIIAASFFLLALLFIRKLKTINEKIIESILAISLVGIGAFWFIERSF